MRFARFRLGLLASIPGLLIGLGPVGAEESRAPAAAETAPPISSEPAATTASFGDWMLRCQGAQIDNKPARICEVAQMIQVQGSSGPIAQIALGRLAAGEPLRVTAVVPTAVSFPSQVRVAVSGTDRSPLGLDWRRCLPGGCYADATVNEATAKRWRAAGEPGRIAFTDASGADAVLPISFRGLAQALDALDRQK